MKAIIFGASGQDGFYLKQLLAREKIETISVSRSDSEVIGDVSNWDFVSQLVKANRPDYIFHFAANSTTQHLAVFENHAAICTGTINILEAAYQYSRHSKVFLTGSAMQFENRGAPIDENTPFASGSAYAVSRIHSVFAGRYYRSLGLNIYVGYFFNHDSPLRTSDHINKKIALSARSSNSIEIGDISVRKEFNFAGDVMEAVWLLVNQEEISEAVIGSGEAHSIEEWLDLCFRCVSKDWHEYVKIKEGFRPEYRVLVSRPNLIKSLGWRPKTSIEDLARMMMEE
jgi:GDPmannose 4,6-dehydratase